MPERRAFDQRPVDQRRGLDRSVERNEHQR
jgi:hypothetical protein